MKIPVSAFLIPSFSFEYLGLLRDAEQQLRSSIKIQPVINTYLDLCNVYLRLDLPNTAIDLLVEARYRWHVIILVMTVDIVTVGERLFD